MDQDANDNEWLHQFGRSILALSAMKKLDKPDMKRTAGLFAQVARDRLRAVGKVTSEIRVSVFVMACFCMDVPVSGLDVPSCSVSLGLSEHDVGKPIDPAAWRAVLINERLPVQHRVERIVEQAPSQVRVSYY